MFDIRMCPKFTKQTIILVCKSLTLNKTQKYTYKIYPKKNVRKKILFVFTKFTSALGLILPNVYKILEHNYIYHIFLKELLMLNTKKNVFYIIMNLIC